MQYKLIVITESQENGKRQRKLAWCIVENNRFLRLCNSSDNPPNL